MQTELGKETAQNYPYKDSDLQIQSRVEDLLMRMSLYEKIGQMTQLDITLINTTGKQKDVVIDPEKARDLILNHHIGSFLNGEAVQPETWYEYMAELTRIAVEETRLGIPVIYGIDHVHGASYLEGSTIFPQGINIGATFNPAHAFNAGQVTAIESVDLGHHWIFAPVLDLAANPLWPRFWETYGEDPHTSSLMGSAFIEGLQNCKEAAPYRQAATAKHFLGYSDPRSGWDRTPVHLSMQQIHEFHRPSFQKAIEAGLKTVMTNSGEINGVPVVASHDILTKLLRDEMGFEGVVVTDWDDIGKLTDFHHTSPNYKEAVYAVVMAGVDMSMTPDHLEFNSSMLELVEEGRINEERIDQSVRRILKLKFELGLFENPFPRDDQFHRIGAPENRQQALDAARESMVLLKNDRNLLPVLKPRQIGMLGHSANSKRNLCGGWTLTWQGGKESQHPDDAHTVYSALKEEFPDAKVLLFDQDEIPSHRDASDTEISSFLEKLNNLDLLIYAAGEEPYCEFTGNINDLRLPQTQRDELNLLSRSKTPIVLILIQGRPRLITELIENVDAIIHAGLPGYQGAKALANVISGTINPGGKLPFSYPKFPNHYLPYNHKKSNLYSFDPDQANKITQQNKTASLYPFGYGLSYTTFKYSDLKLSSKSMTDIGSIKTSVTVTNTGEREGTETAFWFTSTHIGRITRPVKELKHFEKAKLQPGESADLEFIITPETVSYPGEDGRAILELGSYSVIVDELKRDFIIEQKAKGV